MPAEKRQDFFSEVRKLTSGENPNIKDSDMRRMLAKYKELVDEQGVWTAIKYIINCECMCGDDPPDKQNNGALDSPIACSVGKLQTAEGGPVPILMTAQNAEINAEAGETSQEINGIAARAKSGSTNADSADAEPPTVDVSARSLHGSTPAIPILEGAAEEADDDQLNDQVVMEGEEEEEEEEDASPNQEIDSDCENPSLERIENQHYSYYPKDIFPGFGSKEVREDKLFLITNTPQNHRKRICTFASDAQAETSLCLAYGEKVADKDKFLIFKFPINESDPGILYDSESVYKLPNYLFGKVLFTINEEVRVGDIVNFHMELNSSGNFIRWLYTVHENSSGIVFQVDGKCCLPIYEVGDSVIVNHRGIMLPGVVKSVPETTFDDMTVSIFSLTNKSRLRSVSLFNEIEVSLNSNRSPVNTLL